MQIVIAWTEETQELVRAGQIDIGRPHVFKTVTIGKSCMWMNKGTDADVAKAQAYAAKEGRLVFCYENERDPLARARQQVTQ